MGHSVSRRGRSSRTTQVSTTPREPRKCRPRRESAHTSHPARETTRVATTHDTADREHHTALSSSQHISQEPLYTQRRASSLVSQIESRGTRPTPQDARHARARNDTTDTAPSASQSREPATAPDIQIHSPRPQYTIPLRASGRAILFCRRAAPGAGAANLLLTAGVFASSPPERAASERRGARALRELLPPAVNPRNGAHFFEAAPAISSLSCHISPYGRNSSACFAARAEVAAAVI